MTKVYVGSGGNDSNSGLSYALRKLTLAGAEALSLVGGDQVYVAPGVYRETLTPAKAGGSLYNTGTVSVTNGSKTVTGSGTTFTGGSGAFADGVFQITQIAHGTDGVTNGTSAFTSAAGNFQASMVGLTIRINTKKAYIIASYVSATAITVSEPDGTLATPPTAGITLTYDVGPESSYRIASVDSATQLTLDKAWSGPTLTGMAYSTWQDIRYTADVTGQNTDGVGGVVRITGSNNDTTATRTRGILIGAWSYRTFQGFKVDMCTTNQILINGACSNIIIEDFTFDSQSSQFILSCASVVATQVTVRRCQFYFGSAISFSHTVTIDNAAHIVENCLIQVQSVIGIGFTRVGGTLVRNVTINGGNVGVQVQTALTVGQAVTLNNSIISGCPAGTTATANGEIIEDYNTFARNATDRTNVTVGAHSNAFIPIFQPLPLLNNGRVEPWLPFSLMAASGQRNLAGLFPPATDLYGTLRPQETNSDWGAVEALPQPKTATNAGLFEYAIPGRGYIDVLIPVVTATAVTLTASVRWDNNANIGVVPSMTLLADYGVAETSVSAVGTGAAETLTIGPVTPTINAAEPGGTMVLRLLNNSTFASVISAYFTALVAA